MDYETADAIRRKILDDNAPLDAAAMMGELFATNPEVYDALHHREIAPGIHVSNPGPDAGTMTDRYIAGVGATANRYVEGMRNPKRHPVEAATRAAGKWANRTQEAIQNGSYASGVRGQDYAEAVRFATEDGGTAWQAGATKRQAKVNRAFTRLAPLLGGLSQTIQNMPQDTDVQREARLVAALRGMRQIGKQLKSRGATA